MATVFDTLDQQAAPTPPNVGAPTIFDSLPAPEAPEPTPVQKTIFDALPATSAISPSDEQPKPEATGFANQAWQWLNTPLVSTDVINRAISGNMSQTPGQQSPAATALTGAKRGAETFAAGLTSPLSVGLAIASFGTSALEAGLVKAGISAADAAGYVQKGKLAADAAFLTKYGYDFGTNTAPQLEMAWGDYRAAKTDKDKMKALDRLSEMGTESVLNAVAAGFATKGIASDVAEMRAASPKGRAMLQEQYADPVFKLSEMRRTGGIEADGIERDVNRLVPNDARQAAIYHNIEALGDPNVLEQRATKADQAGNTKLGEEVRSGKELNDKEKQARDLIQGVMQANGNDLRATGRLPADSESAGYLPHKYAHEYLDPQTKKPVPGLAGGEGFLQKRMYDNIVDAELAGLAPIKNIAELVGDYHENAANVLAKDAYAESLLAGRTNEGAPLAAPQVVRRGGVLGAQDALIDPKELTTLKSAGTLDTLIQSGQVIERLNAETSDPEYLWRQTDFEPSGAGHTVTGLNVIRDGQRIPLALNPEIAPHALALLEQANPSKLTKFALRASSGAKSAIVALSPFHYVTMADRMLELVKNPLQRPNIDWQNPSPELKAGLRDGLMIGGRGGGRVAEGLTSSRESVFNRIPLVGGLNKLIEENLFGSSGYISGLKVDAYTTLKRAIMRSSPNLDDVQAGRIAASQVNNKFGGLNYDVLGRGANTQTALRLMLLAPDFLESTGRSILDVAGEHGQPLLKRLVAFNVAQWMLARGINYLVSGDTHPESGLSVRSKDGKREYSMRTTLGDFLHFAEKPLDFVANRVNPLGRAAAEDFYGVDEQGHKVTDTQKFFDTLRQMTPIPLQGIYPNQQISQASATDKLLQSGGIQSRKYFTPAETLAQKLMTERSGEGAPLEGDALAKAQFHYQLEDRLRTAINARDNSGRVAAIRAIHEASSGPDAKITAKEASSLIQQANKYPSPIQATTERLSLEDALQVWDKAGFAERRALRPIIQQKIEKWQLSSNDRTRQQNDSMRSRIQAFRFSLTE